MPIKHTIALVLSALILLAFTPDMVQGQSATARGMATLNYTGRFGPQHQEQVRRQARIAALDSYVAEHATPAMARLFSDRRDYFTRQVDRYVINTTELSNEHDSRQRVISMVVRSEINAALLRADIDAMSATASTASHERSLMTLLFMARTQDTVQVFDDRVHRREDRSSSVERQSTDAKSTTEGERVSRSSIQTSTGVSTQSTEDEASSASVTTGGSVTQRSDRVQWRVTTSQEINSAMTGMFSSAGYEVVEAEYVEAESGGHLSIQRIRGDFSSGDDLSPEVLQSTVRGIRTAEIPYLAIGTLDVGMRDTDPVTGNTRVYVTVTGRVMDLSGRFPRTVASVGPVQYAGLGPSETIARNNALTLAAERAAQELIDGLNVRGVR